MSHRFSVLAPDAGSVEVVVGGERLAMRREPDGWWALEHPAAAAGDDYSFCLDGGPPVPDPRSALQPAGVHGPSRIVDLAAQPWSDAGWRGLPLEDAILYELHCGTFTPEGTLDAAAARLDALVDLGVTAVELMPVAAFPGERGWGYDGVDLFAVHIAYGGPDALCRFVDACHARGLACVLDVVYNHLGPDGNVLGAYGPYFTDAYRTPWGQAINVDGRGSDGTRAFIVDNALRWLRDFHLDGLRLDAVHAIVDGSALHILEELSTAVRALEAELGRRLWLIAESDLNDPRLVRPTSEGGYGCDAQWSDDFHHALWSALSGERDGYYADFGELALVGRALERGVVFEGQHSAHRGRRHGRPYDRVPRQRLLGYLQNHDQVGNRALGERSAQVLDAAALRAGAALVLLSPFTPLLLMGEEWGATTPFQYFTDHSDPELGRAVSQGRRAEFAAFGWPADEVPDPQDSATFARSRLDWAQRGRPDSAALLDWHRALIRLRRERAELRDGAEGATAASVDEAARVLAMRRGVVVVACNLGERPVRVEVGDEPRLLLGAAGASLRAEEGSRLELGPGETVVVEAGDAGCGRPGLDAL